MPGAVSESLPMQLLTRAFADPVFRLSIFEMLPFRHSFVTRLLEDSYEIQTLPELLGHNDVSTRTIYTHVLNRGARVN